jgi:hypothetical protein
VAGRSVATQDRVGESDEVGDADKNEPKRPVEGRQDVGGVKDREDGRSDNADNDRAALVPLPREPTPQRHSSDGFSIPSARPAYRVGSRRARCEHAFVSTEGSSYVRFRRSLETQNLGIVLPAAAELAWINLGDSLEILTLMAKEGDLRFDRAAARWVGRVLVETPPMTLKEARWVIAMVEQLPRCRESLHRFARRR